MESAVHSFVSQGGRIDLRELSRLGQSWKLSSKAILPSFTKLPQGAACSSEQRLASERTRKPGLSRSSPEYYVPLLDDNGFCSTLSKEELHQAGLRPRRTLFTLARSKPCLCGFNEYCILWNFLLPITFASSRTPAYYQTTNISIMENPR